MTDAATSTIAQLLFRSQPLLDLGGLLGDLDAALGGELLAAAGSAPRAAAVLPPDAGAGDATPARAAGGAPSGAVASLRADPGALPEGPADPGPRIADPAAGPAAGSDPAFDPGFDGRRIVPGMQTCFDLPGSRITIGFAEDLTGEYRACLSIGVGPRPGTAQRPQGASLRRRARAKRGAAPGAGSGSGPGAAPGQPGSGATGATPQGAAGPAARDRLCRIVAARIERSFPPDRIVWHEVEGQVTPELLRRFATDLPPEFALRLPGPRDAAAPRQPLLAPQPQGAGPDRAAQPPEPPPRAGDAAAAAHGASPVPPRQAAPSGQAESPFPAPRPGAAQAEAAAQQSRLGRLPPPPPDCGAVAEDLDRMLRRLDRSLAERGAVALRPAREDAPTAPEALPPAVASGRGPAGYRPALPQVAGARHRSRATRAAVAARFPPIEEVASGMPDLPLPAALASQDAAEDREAARSTPAAEPPSVPLRLACHAINATVMVIALPIGAAMMTYSILRGENLTVSARTLAVMGVAVGLRDLPVGAQLLSML